MNEEFPQIEERDYQKEFLANWWSKRKLFRAERGSGKTTMMVCEARRFSENGFSVTFLAPTVQDARIIKEYYKELFGEQPTFSIESYKDLATGALRGRRDDVVICDEFQEIDLEKFNKQVMPMDPKFVRASACKARMGRVHYLKDQNGGGFFDSVYEY